MLYLASLALAASADPLSVRWAGGALRLVVTPPPGEHVNADAPARLANGVDEVRGRGDLAAARLPLAGGPLDLSAEVTLCTDDGAQCRTLRGVARVAAPGRAGTVVLSGEAPAAPGAAPGVAVKLLDFSAVWCPPCNQMRAEVLEDPADAPALAGLAVEMVDADRPESWALKTRHQVGGYPTLVAVDAAGAEVDRYVGYSGEAHLLAWIAALDGITPLASLPDAPPAGVDAALAGATALRLARGQREDQGRRWLVAAGDDVAAHHARLLLAPARADADWLVAHAPAGDWVADALYAYPELWPAVAHHVPALPTPAALGALDAWAGAAPPTEARTARVAMLALLRTQMGDSPDTQRGYVVDYTDTLAKVGDLAGALAMLDRFAALYPEEFTFDHAAARLCLEAKRLPEAEARARVALGKAWGDQRLREAQQLAKALDGQGRRAEAVAVLEAELAAAPRPGPDVTVRTTRYLDQAEALLRELGG